MTTATQPHSLESLPARLGWALADSWTLARRNLAHWARQPGQVIGGIAFMVMLVVLYGSLFGGAMKVPGGGDYYDFLMPGMFVMTMAFGIGETMAAMNSDAGKGITDRFRSMPMSGAAVVVGRSIADMLYSTVGLTAMLLCGLVLGWRATGGPGDAVLAVLLLLLLRFAMLWAGVFLGLLVKNAEMTSVVQMLLFPFTMLTNTFAAPDTMPGWLGAICEWNPLSATITAVRELFGNPGVGGGGLMVDHAVLVALLWPLLAVAVFVPLSAWRYRRLSR